MYNSQEIDKNSYINIPSTSEENKKNNSHFNKAFSNSNKCSLRKSLKEIKLTSKNPLQIQEKEFSYTTLQQLCINQIKKTNSFQQNLSNKEDLQIEESLSLNKKLKKNQQFERKLEKLRRAYYRKQKQNLSISDCESSDTLSINSLDMYIQNKEKKSKTSNLKEALLGRRARKFAFWFIVAFLAGLTIKDVYNLVINIK